MEKWDLKNWQIEQREKEGEEDRKCDGRPGKSGGDWGRTAKDRNSWRQVIENAVRET